MRWLILVGRAGCGGLTHNLCGRTCDSDITRHIFHNDAASTDFRAFTNFDVADDGRVGTD